jgi:hypothetical protein
MLAYFVAVPITTIKYQAWVEVTYSDKHISLLYGSTNYNHEILGMGGSD